MIVGRREFILGAGAAVTWPVVPRAQQPAARVIGFLTSLGRNERPNLRDAFIKGLAEANFVEGRDVVIDYRFAENQYDQLPALAADLAGRNVALIAATGGANSVVAAKRATSTIPILFTLAGDPVQLGFVESLNRPGRNITGVSWFGSILSGKALGLLFELVPKAALVAFMVNPEHPENQGVPGEAQKAAHALGRDLFVLSATSRSEIDTAFAELRARRADALLVSSDPFYTSRRQQIIALATRDAIPAMYLNREFVTEGGLISYGNDVVDAYRRLGLYAARILKGENAAELPVDQASRFEFVINLKTAKSLGLEVPPSLSARVDEVIE